MNQNFPFIIRSQIAPKLHNIYARYAGTTHFIRQGLPSHTSIPGLYVTKSTSSKSILEVGIEICVITESWIKSDDSLTPVDISPP